MKKSAFTFLVFGVSFLCSYGSPVKKENGEHYGLINSETEERKEGLITRRPPILIPGPALIQKQVEPNEEYLSKVSHLVGDAEEKIKKVAVKEEEKKRMAAAEGHKGKGGRGDDKDKNSKENQSEEKGNKEKE